MLLVDLPSELVVEVVAHLDDPREISRSAGISKFFHDPLPPDPNANPNAPPPHSIAEEGIRLWLQTRGYELPALCVGDACAVRSLCFAALVREYNPPARVAAGLEHSIFINGEGLFSCGAAGTDDDPGYPDNHENEGVPTRFSSLLLGGERATSVSTRGEHNLALAADGSVWSWGHGGAGQLGHGDRQNQLLPKKVEEAFAGQRVVAVSAGCDHSLAITADGALWSWGTGSYRATGHVYKQCLLVPTRIPTLAGQRVVAVSAGEMHSLAITADGSVWSWGNYNYGVLGHGDERKQYEPKKIEAFQRWRVVAVSANGHHSLAITADGAAWSWGRGWSGCLGHGDEEEHWQPKKIEAFAGQRVVAVSAGEWHSLALTADGAVWSWGMSGSKLGHGMPPLPLDEEDVDYWSLAECHIEEEVCEDVLLPKKIDALAGQRVVAVSAGMVHSLALAADGAFWSWGSGYYDKLGYNCCEQWEPKEIEGLSL